MNWKQIGNRHLCTPYQVINGIRGYEAWIREPVRYSVLGREIPTAAAAKALCEKHSLGAVFVK